MSIHGSSQDLERRALGAYFEAVREHPPLSRKVEHALALRVREGDVTAKQKLVRHNLRLVVAVAFKQRRGTLRLDDLIQEGNVGLLRAADRFDPHAGTRFSTYATWWIRAYLGKYLREARSTVRPPSGTLAQPDLSLDGGVGPEGEPAYADTMKDDGPGPEDSHLSTESDRVVRDALGEVRGRIGDLGWDIVHSRLEQDSPTPLEEIGKRWGVSRERARQVELKTKHLLKCHLGRVCPEAV